MRFHFSLFFIVTWLVVSAQEHPGFRILLRDNQYGAINDFDEVMIPFEFQRLEILYTGLATQAPRGVHPRNMHLLASRDGKSFSILDGAGKVVFPYRFTKMVQLHYFYPAERTTYGNLITSPPPYDEVLVQTAIIFRFDSAGVVNGNGEQILPFEYRDVKPIYGSPHPSWVSVHTKEGQVGIFDLHGYWLIEPRFADVPEVFRNIQLEDMPMYPTLLVANEEKEGRYKYGLIDSVGRTVIPFEYDEFGLAFTWNEQWKIWAKKGGKWGMIDYENREVIPFEYGRPNGRYLIDGQLCLSVMSADPQLYGIISEKNEVLIPFEYQLLKPGNDRLLLFTGANKKSGLVDLKGREVLPAAYDAIAFLRYGYFSLHDYENKVRGVADSDGKIVVEPGPYNGIYPEDMLQRFSDSFQAMGIAEAEVVTVLTRDEGTWALLRNGELLKLE